MINDGKRVAGVSALAGVLLLAVAAHAEAPGRRVDFRVSEHLKLGHTPIALAVGSLDTDLAPDVLVANDDSTVTTLLGDGAGGLRARVDRVVAPDLMGVALGDVNHDGLQDAVVSASSSGAVFMLLGVGDGTFAAGDTLRGPWTPGAVALPWLYGSAAPDLVVADLFFQDIVVLRNDGSGMFTLARQLTGFVDPVAMAFGWVNCCGGTDMVVADQASRTASVLLDLGLGGAVARHDLPLGGRPIAVAVGDLNADGLADAIVATRGPSMLVVLLGAADGSLRPAYSYAAGTDLSAVAVWDFDRDGRADVAVADRAGNSIGIWLGAGDGSLVQARSIPTGAAPTALAAADMNGDGWTDLVCTNHDDGSVQVLLNTTSPPPGGLRLFAPSPNPTHAGCTLSFVLATAADVQVEIHDLNGRLVRRLHEPGPTFFPGGVYATWGGTHHLTWDGLTDAGDPARSGLYFARVRAGAAEATTRIVLER